MILEICELEAGRAGLQKLRDLCRWGDHWPDCDGGRQEGGPGKHRAVGCGAQEEGAAIPSGPLQAQTDQRGSRQPCILGLVPPSILGLLS